MSLPTLRGSPVAVGCRGAVSAGLPGALGANRAATLDGLILMACGCSDGGVGQLGPLGRLDVTPTLRNACNGVAGGDPMIEATIYVLEEARLDGGLFIDGVVVINQSCPFEACITCSLAVLNQVYDI